MRYAVISDIHSNYFSLLQILKDAKEKNIDKFIFLGDYITDGIYDNEVLELVKQYGTYVISGNREQYLCGFLRNNNYNSNYNNEKPLFYSLNQLSSENKDYILSLPKEQIIELNQKKILLTHGNNPTLVEVDPKILKSIIDEYKIDICLYGHTHISSDFSYGSCRFLNPGSSGIPADGPYYSYGILSIEKEITFDIIHFSTRENFSKLKEVYEKSNYYKQNMIWCNLILESIYEGKDVIEPFIKNIQESLKLYQTVDENLYNTLWERSYYLKKK